MDRGLIVGAIAFAAAFGVERLYASLEKDIKRYETMRRMSGQQPIFKELTSTIFGNTIDKRDAAREATGFVGSLVNDAIRYAKIRSM